MKIRIISVIITIIGLTLSIALHELLHIILHWDKITNISFFSGDYIVRITATTPNNYNVMAEEIVAYSITACVVAITVLIVHYINKKKNK